MIPRSILLPAFGPEMHRPNGQALRLNKACPPSEPFSITPLDFLELWIIRTENGYIVGTSEVGK